MPLLCPDDGHPLQTHPAGASCLTCGGVLCESDQIGLLSPGATAATVAPETRESSPAFARPRSCPHDGTAMAPYRIGKMEAWIEHCPECQRWWVERIDTRTLTLQAKQSALQGAYASYSDTEKQELARDLARETVGDTYPISAFHQFLATLGLPVVRRTQGDTIPLATWSIAVVLTAVFTYEQLNGGAEEFARMHGFDPAQPTLLTALGANLLHFGWLHLLGNLYFLLSFGDGVEQRVPRVVVLLLFAGLGTAALGLDGALTDSSTVIAGASGGIAALMGACIVLQPQARVVMRIGAPVIELPIWAYGAIEMAYQSVMSLFEVPGTAWVAHLAGIALGVASGLAARRLWPRGSAATA